MIGKYAFFALVLLPLACVSGTLEDDYSEDPGGTGGNTPGRGGSGNAPNGGSSQAGTNNPRGGTGGGNSSGGTTPGSGGTQNKGGSTGTGGTTNPDPNQPCNFPKYQKGTAYQLGDKVIFNGKAYEATDPNAAQGDPVNSPALWSEYTGCKVVIPPCASVPGCPMEKVGGCKWFEGAFPNRHSLYTYESACTAMKAFPQFASSGNDTSDKRELAAFFANVSHETGFLEHTEEIGKATGGRYYGRGPIQLTHDYNYRDCGAALGEDLLGDPDLLTKDSVISWKSALWFWMSYTGPNGNCHQAIAGGSFGRTIVVINGCDKPETRVAYYQDFCRAFNLTDIGSTSC